MLGKLMKNEIKQSSRYFLVLLASAGIVILLMIATLLLRVERMNFIASLVLLLVGGISVLMAVVLVIKNFNDTLYKEQGYLTFTLPVSGPMLLFSKVLVSFFCHIGCIKFCRSFLDDWFRQYLLLFVFRLRGEP